MNEELETILFNLENTLSQISHESGAWYGYVEPLKDNKKSIKNYITELNDYISTLEDQLNSLKEVKQELSILLLKKK